MPFDRTKQALGIDEDGFSAPSEAIDEEGQPSIQPNAAPPSLEDKGGMPSWEAMKAYAANPGIAINALGKKMKYGMEDAENQGNYDMAKTTANMNNGGSVIQREPTPEEIAQQKEIMDKSMELASMGIGSIGKVGKSTAQLLKEAQMTKQLAQEMGVAPKAEILRPMDLGDRMQANIAARRAEEMTSPMAEQSRQEAMRQAEKARFDSIKKLLGK